MVNFLKLKTKDLKRSRERREKMEERRGKGRVWSEGRPVFIGEIRHFPAFVNAAMCIVNGRFTFSRSVALTGVCKRG